MLESLSSTDPIFRELAGLTGERFCRCSLELANASKPFRPRRSVLYLINPQFCNLPSMRWDRHVKTIRIMCRKVKSCSCADRGRNVCPQPVMIGVSLLENTDDSFAPDYVNTLAVRVIVHVIRVASTG